MPELTLEDLLLGRKKIRVGIPIHFLYRDEDYEYFALQAFERSGATDITNLKRVNPEPRDRRKYGKKIYVYTAVATPPKGGNDG